MPTCEIFQGQYPANLTEIATATLTAEFSAKLVGLGGQACYLELKNNTLHATPLTVRFFDLGPTGETDACTSTFIMTPGFGVKKIFKQTKFGNRITWRCEVSTAVDVDVANIICTLFALPI